MNKKTKENINDNQTKTKEVVLGLNNLEYKKGSKQKKERLGRGCGSKGKTSGRGSKGQKARKSGNVRPGFEGGQTVFYRLVPKKGFRHFHIKKKYKIIDFNLLNKLGLENVTPEILLEKGIIKKKRTLIKLLSNGEFNQKIEISVHKISKSAYKIIKKNMGKVNLIK
jgi:large subunit ribosomal protein L15